MVRASIYVDAATGVAELVMNSPLDRNALSLQMLQDLQRGLDAAAGDTSIRSLVIVAEGPDFCLGADASDLALIGGMSPIDARRFMAPRVDMLETLLMTLFALPVPTVAAIAGQAAGAGIALALATDFRVMGRTAKLNLAYASLGLPSDGGNAWLLGRHLGVAGALRLLLTQQVIRAGDAFQAGIADNVVPKGEERVAASHLAVRLASLPRVSAAGAVTLLRLDQLDQFQTHMNAEHNLFLDSLGTQQAEQPGAGCAPPSPPPEGKASR